MYPYIRIGILLIYHLLFQKVLMYPPEFGIQYYSSCSYECIFSDLMGSEVYFCFIKYGKRIIISGIVKSKCHRQ